MDELRIDDRETLTQWLQMHHGFPDLFVLRMEPRPRTNAVPVLPTVTLELATQIDGGFEAGEMRTLRVFQISAEEVRTFWIEDPRRYDAGYCDDTGIRQLDTDGLGLQLHVPSRVQLVCGAIVVRELADREEIIQPWIDDMEMGVKVVGYELPSPADLISMFAQEGVSVVWRRFGEGPQPADHVPADYSGWYVQQPERFAKDAGDGIFVFGASARQGSFVLHVQNHDPLNRELWRAMQQMLLHYPNIEIRTGNCRLNASLWRQYMNDGYITAPLPKVDAAT